MKEIKLAFSSKVVEFQFDTDFRTALKKFDAGKTIIITDENINKYHAEKFEGYDLITIPAGEIYKTQETVDKIINKLLSFDIDKNSTLVAVGGGVVTDITGFVASIFKRGIKLVNAPTSILGMADAAIGGKNGIDVGAYKNMIGTVYQPDKILFDYNFLNSLPKTEWINGFAEIIKHACIKDQNLFAILQNQNIEHYMGDRQSLATLIEKNVSIKTDIVLNDEFENGDRKLLNFGHTVGHAIENIYQLPHGHAISIGMIIACQISEKINNFSEAETLQIKNAFEKYNLPIKANVDKEKIWEILLADKKRDNAKMNFVLLNKIGEAKISAIPLEYLKNLLDEIL